MTYKQGPLFPFLLSVPRGGGSFRQEKLSNVLIENLATRQYLRGICSEKIVYASPNPGLSFGAGHINVALVVFR